MLFDRFIFVLYTLSAYSWFLLGMHYDSPWRFIPLLSMILSLFCIIIIALFQIQKLFLQQRSSSADRWSTVLWSIVHVALCMLMLLDGLEYINPLLVFALSGVVLSLVVLTVGSCSCHVILRNSHSWTPHIHLTCISFWVVMHFVTLRFPESPMEWMTTPPVLCMTMIRGFEWLEDRHANLKEGCLWVFCCMFHILYDPHQLPRIVLYWGMVTTVSVMCILTKHHKELLLFISVPFICVPIVLYLVVSMCIGIKYADSVSIILGIYEDILNEPDIEPEPLDTASDIDWEERL